MITADKLMPFRRGTEIATIVVGGRRFDDWTSVEVQARVGDTNSTFTFECTEKPESGLPPATGARRAVTETLQFMPGARCEVYLSKQLAVTGFITMRQAGYDAENHGVQLAGKSATWDIASSSVVDKSKFDGYPWAAIARKLIAPFGIALETVGSVDTEPFEQMTVQPGELVWSALERLARSRKIVLGSTERGNLLAIGPHRVTVIDTLVEGGNILRANCTIQDDYVYQKYFAIGQRSGSDGAWGDEVSQIAAVVQGSAKRYRPIVEVAEHPETPSGVKKRAEFAALVHEGAEVIANITVQGWTRSNGDLWRCGTYLNVRSPMLALYDVVLCVKSITFRQDERSGTTTTLELLLPWRMNGNLNWGPNQGPPAAGTILPPDAELA